MPRVLARRAASVLGEENARSLTARVGAVLLTLATVVVGMAVGAVPASAACQETGPPDWECSNGYEYSSDLVQNVLVGQRSPGAMLPGGSATFRVSLAMADDSERSITKITHHAPVGFAYRSARLAKATWVDNHYDSQTPLPVQAKVGLIDGTVTVTAPEGGWPIAGNASRISLHLYVTYDVLSPIAGTSGVTFAATDIPETKAPVATATVDPLERITAVGSAMLNAGSAGS